MILDANVLLYAADSTSPHHDSAVNWLEDALNGDARVGFPIQTLTAFVRISTHPRIMRSPLSADEATGLVADWLAVPVAWVPSVGATTWSITERLLRAHGSAGNLVPDAALAAVAIEHAVPIVSADTDFARFTDVTWVNPIAGRA